jgi:hypothetical protein
MAVGNTRGPDHLCHTGTRGSSAGRCQRLCNLGELGCVKEDINECSNDAEAEILRFLFPDFQHAKPQDSDRMCSEVKVHPVTL